MSEELPELPEPYGHLPKSTPTDTGFLLEQIPVYTADQVRQAVLAERAKSEGLREALEIIAAQYSGKLGSTDRADCMAAIAAAAIRKGLKGE